MPNKEYSGFVGDVSPLSITIFCIVLFVAWDFYRKRRFLKFASTLNGFRFFPIIGNAYHLVGFDLFSNLRKFHETFCGGCIWIGHIFFYVTLDPAEIKVILNNQNTFDKLSAYENLEIFFGDSLLLAKSDRWKKNRKSFSKCFSQPILQSYVETIYERSNIFVKGLDESQFLGVQEVFENLSLEIFFATILGLDCDEVNREGLLELLRSIEKFLQSRMITSYLYPDFIAYLSQEGKRVVESIKNMKIMINEVLREPRKAFKAREIKNDQKPTVVDILLEGEGTIFNEDELFREILLFIGAATETSGGTMAFTFTLLGMNPHVQEEVYREVESVVGNHRSISYDDLSNLKYTERAIRESMRLLPVTPFLGRHTTADVDIGTRTLPAGCDIILSVFYLHRSELYWPNPLEYNPDRFLPEEVAKRHPYTYIPFSGGPRNCIGMKYAMLLMKMVVANVIRNYRVTSNYKSVEDLKFTSGVSMKTTHKLDCVFTPRTH